MEAILARIRAEVAAKLQAARDLIATRPSTPTPPPETAPTDGENNGG